MVQLMCSCGNELYREYKELCDFEIPDGMSRLVEAHKRLGHKPELYYREFSGKGWDDIKEEDL